MPFVAICICLAVSFLVYSMLNRPVPIGQRRLARVPGRVEAVSAQLDEDDRPTRRQVLEAKLGQLLPHRTRERLAQFIQGAGMTATPETVVAIWAAVGIGVPTLYLASILRSGQAIGQKEMLIGLFTAGISLYLPLALIKSRVRKRRTKLLRAMPDMMDLMVTCVEAGLGIDAALARVSEKAKEPLRDEVRLVLHMMSMGRTRRESLEALAARTGLQEIASFTRSVVQAEQMGVSLGQVLRVQAEALRVQRKQRAEQAAYKAPIKIIVVLVLLIFPSMFVVILGPAALKIMNGGLQ